MSGKGNRISLWSPGSVPKPALLWLLTQGQCPGHQLGLVLGLGLGVGLELGFMELEFFLDNCN